METWEEHRRHIRNGAFNLSISRIEAITLSFVVLTLLITIVDTLNGVGVGNEEKIKLAKLQAQQELMAQHPASE